MIVCPYASPLYIRSNISDKLTVTPILATSEDSVALRYDQDTDSEVKTADGPFYLGIKSQETYDDGYSEMIVYSGAYIVSDMFLWNGPYANERLAVASIRELTPYQSPVLAPVKNVENSILAVTSQESTLIGVLYIGLFPAAILILGGLNLIRRRNSARRQ